MKPGRRPTLANRGRRAGWIAALVFGLAAPGAAVAQDPGRTGTWLVEPLANDGATVDLRFNGKDALEARILPVKLAKPESDYADGAGALLIKAGSQLVWVPAMGGLHNDRDLFCAFRSLANSSNPLWRSNVASNQLNCFVDADGNGEFESYELCYSFYPSLLIDGKCHPEMLPLRGARYRIADRGEFNSDMRLKMRFLYGAAQLCIGGPKDCSPLGQGFAVGAIKPGEEFSWPGSKLRLEAISKGQIRLTVLKIDKPQALNIAAPWSLFTIWM